MEVDKTKSFGEGTPKIIPDTVDNLGKMKKEEEDKYTATSLAHDTSLKEKLPKPTGYRILILPFVPPRASKVGILLANQTIEKERLATNVGFVVSLGPDAYKDSNKFPEGPWCQERDWVIFGRYAGARIKIDGGDLRLLNDDEILAKIDDPEEILSSS